uniref:Lipase_GDSL domain-containing protein n=1 Tax=Steinernema glaseri TaxID=37863 RepID=A0A1I7Y4T8_9BILA
MMVHLKNGLLFCVLVSVTRATISSSFKTYLDANFGAGVGDAVARTDVGGGGSYGGGSHEGGTPTSRQPVIIVHGITNNAGNFDKIRDHFLSKGYTDEDIYGTTYGDSGKTNVLFVTMECSYVKHIRMFIQAVASFTSSKVDILGFSMGSPIARKAILGGTCVDTGEQLGPPLTDLVDTFVGIAGANHGSFLCLVPFGSCNMVNGMSCFSRYLSDINAKKRYEGAHIFTIYSTGDEKVGHQACGKLASAIDGEDQSFQKEGLNHDGVMYGTVDMQYNLVNAHSA